MADRRSVRASSRRKTPTPQPQQAQSPQQTRAVRRSTRSQSRDVEASTQPATKTRASEGDDGKRKGRGAKAVQPKRLSIVPETITLLSDEEDPLRTPPAARPEEPLPHRSPGGVSEMSGTTAISSLSQADAEDLDAELMLEHMDDLFSACKKLLEVVAPDRQGLAGDMATIKELRMPESRSSERFRKHDEALEIHLDIFRKPPQQYVKRQAVLQTLFGADRDVSSIRSAADLIVFKANLVVFAKQMISSEREQKFVWDAIRELDTAFPKLFLSGFTEDPSDEIGKSALLEDTFQLALNLRTQLAILVLMHASEQETFDPDKVVQEVFLYQTEDDRDYKYRGWEIRGLGGDGVDLPANLRDDLLHRIDDIRKYFNQDTQSLEIGEYVDFDALLEEYPWRDVVLSILEWVRCRNREIDSTVRANGGIDGIIDMLKDEMASPASRANPAGTSKPTKETRTSLGERRRKSKNFDPDMSMDSGMSDFMKKKLSKLGQQNAAPQATEDHPAPVREIVHEESPRVGSDVDDEEVPRLGSDIDEQEVLDEHPATGPINSQPPASQAAAYAARIKSQERIEKENRRRRFIDAQPDAERIEFGDGFDDTQATRPPPRPVTSKLSQSKSNKRRRHDSSDSEGDSDAFETDDRPRRIQERRDIAPVKKHARFDVATEAEPSSAPQSSIPRTQNPAPPRSSAPPSYQLPAQSSGRVRAQGYPEREQQRERAREREQAPDRRRRHHDVDQDYLLEPEELDDNRAPLEEVRRLARQHEKRSGVRKARKNWTAEEEKAFIEYMAKYPRGYAQILAEDAAQDAVLQDRDQVNLKDKAVNLAMLYIKARCGLPDGFEDVITRDSKRGRELIARGFRWW